MFALATAQGMAVDAARTMAINTLVAMEVFYLFSIRYRHASTLTLDGVRGTPAVWIAVGVVVVLQAAFTYLPPMQLLFDTVALSPLQLAQCAAAGVLVLVVLEFDKLAARRRRARNGAGEAKTEIA